MSSMVKLNVGGVRYEVSTMTLLRHPDSMLARMCQQPREAAMIEEGRELVVDRDGSHFGHILNYLRDGDQVIVPADDRVRLALVKEADFYGLTGFMTLLKPFKPGDQVLIADVSGQEYLDATVCKPKGVDRCCCWVCQKLFVVQWRVRIGTLTKKPEPSWEKLFGTILEIDGNCVEVGFPRSLLMGIYQIDGGAWRKNVVVKIHVPLKYLKLA